MVVGIFQLKATGIGVGFGHTACGVISVAKGKNILVNGFGFLAGINCF